MNREQRRKAKKDKPISFTPKKVARGSAVMSAFVDAAPKQPDFSGVPLATVCQSIQMLVNELYRRGYPVYDFDNKDKFVQGIQIIQGKVYFLVAAEEDDNDGKA